MIAYKTLKYKLIQKYEIGFERQDCDILCKPNVALFLLLESKNTGARILVVNCHILFNKNRGDIKYFQVGLIMKAIREISKRHNNGRNRVIHRQGYPCDVGR